MVSTRQMSIVSGGISECANQVTDHGPARSTRNNPVIIPSEPSTSHGRSTQTKQNIFLLDMPQEVIEKILSYLSFKNICQLRLVSSKF